MAFVPKNYLTALRAVEQIVTDATAYDANVDRALQQIVQAASALDAMDEAFPTGWLDAVQFINTAAADESGSVTVWRDLKARTDKIVTDFTAMRNSAAAVRDAAQTARSS